MGFADWFTRSRTPAAPADLRSSLLAAVAAKNSASVTQLFRANRDEIRALFPQWTTVPMELRQNETLLGQYGEMLITIARLFEQEGDGSLMASLQGDPADSPIESWNRDIAAAQALSEAGRYAEAASLLAALRDSMKTLRGSAIDFYWPRLLGKLGVALYQAGDEEAGREATREARDFCASIGDEEGVEAYTRNLEAMDSE